MAWESIAETDHFKILKSTLTGQLNIVLILSTGKDSGSIGIFSEVKFEQLREVLSLLNPKVECTCPTCKAKLTLKGLLTFQHVGKQHKRISCILKEQTKCGKQS